jgi:hypothetical protein
MLLPAMDTTVMVMAMDTVMVTVMDMVMDTMVKLPYIEQEFSVHCLNKS